MNLRLVCVYKANFVLESKKSDLCKSPTKLLLNSNQKVAETFDKKLRPKFSLKQRYSVFIFSINFVYFLSHLYFLRRHTFTTHLTSSPVELSFFCKTEEEQVKVKKNKIQEKNCNSSL